MYTYNAEVQRVIDGDTVDINIDLGFDVSLRNQRIRLVGIDTAEVRTTDEDQKWFGMIAKQYVIDLLKDKSIVLHSKEFKGKFGRILGDLYIVEDDKFLTTTLLEDGLAVEYSGSKEKKIEMLSEALVKYRLKINNQ